METMTLFTIFIYSLRSFTALFWGILLFFYRKRSLQNIFLSIIFILIGLLYLRNNFMRLPVVEDIDVYNPLSYFILIFIAPFAIFYAYFSLGEKHSLRHCLMHFIPFICVGLLWAALTLSGVPHIPFCYSLTKLLGYVGQYPLYVCFFVLMMLTFIAQVLTYFSMALVRFVRVWKEYRKYNVSVHPLKMLIIMDFLFMIYPLVCVVFMSFNNDLHFGIGFNIFVAVVITTLSVLNINLRLPLKTDLSFIVQSKQAVPEYATNNNLIERIENVFVQKELFRLPHLRLQDVAEELGTNRSYVSACINSHYGYNFNQLLIMYRINAAKDLLQNSNMSIQRIVEHVGFNTYASFYRAFKDNVSPELSPIEWRKIHRKVYANIERE